MTVRMLVFAGCEVVVEGGEVPFESVVVVVLLVWRGHGTGLATGLCVSVEIAIGHGLLEEGAIAARESARVGPAWRQMYAGVRVTVSMVTASIHHR